VPGTGGAEEWSVHDARTAAAAEADRIRADHTRYPHITTARVVDRDDYEAQS
jgi:hypothetical protein